MVRMKMILQMMIMMMIIIVMKRRWRRIVIRVDRITMAMVKI